MVAFPWVVNFAVGLPEGLGCFGCSLFIVGCFAGGFAAWCGVDII